MLFKASSLHTIALLIIAIMGPRLTFSADVNSELFKQIDENSLNKLNELKTEANLQTAVNFGEDLVKKLNHLETIISKSNAKVLKGSISYSQLIDAYASEQTIEEDIVAKGILKSTAYFHNNYCKGRSLSGHDVALFLTSTDLPISTLKHQCTKILENKEFENSYRRLLPANYKDGIYKIRKGVEGSELPSAREISRYFHEQGEKPQKKYQSKNIAFVQWTQFIEQDLVKTVVQKMAIGQNIECCSKEHSNLAPRHEHPSCLPIRMTTNDKFYSKYYATCLNYVRSALSVGEECKFGPANQINEATSHLDMSQIYGNSFETMKQMKLYRNGFLQGQISERMDYPLNGDSQFCAHNETCYTSGDSRVNANPFITLLHTIFLRSHNKIAKKLAILNPKWNDRRLFQTAKLINTGIYQKIIFNDWAVEVFGTNNMTKKSKNGKAMIVNNGTYQRIYYDQMLFEGKNLDGRVSNEFATAAIRFYNTMMPDKMADLKLQDLSYKPKDITKKEYFKLLTNLTLEERATSYDTSYAEDLIHFLFKTNDFGSDQLALDIQRGRDHGLNGYIKYFEFCNNRKVMHFDDLRDIVNENDLESLKTLYNHVEDIDLIVGLLSEKPAGNDALVGPTLLSIIGEQMVTSLLDDPNTTDELNLRVQKTIDNYTASRLLCDTINVGAVQENIFNVPSSKNAMVRCNELQKLNLMLWKE